MRIAEQPKQFVSVSERQGAAAARTNSCRAHSVNINRRGPGCLDLPSASEVRADHFMCSPVQLLMLPIAVERRVASSTLLKPGAHCSILLLAAIMSSTVVRSCARATDSSTTRPGPLHRDQRMHSCSSLSRSHRP